jgi:hypothetical protein
MSNDKSRDEFEAWAIGILGDNPLWRESGNCELAWQSWQASRKVALNEAAEVCTAWVKSHCNDSPECDYVTCDMVSVATDLSDVIKGLI